MSKNKHYHVLGPKGREKFDALAPVVQETILRVFDNSRCDICGRDGSEINSGAPPGFREFRIVVSKIDGKVRCKDCYLKENPEAEWPF